MLFGQSVFQSVLTRLDAEGRSDEPDETPPGTAGFRVFGLSSGFVAALDSAAACGQAQDAYRDGIETARGFDPQADAETAAETADGHDTPPAEQSGAEPDHPATRAGTTARTGVPPPASAAMSTAESLRHLARLAPQEVAGDLALTAADTLADLTEKRRLFARSNHPDRVPEDFRAAANTRMKIANRLIDEAINRLPRA